MAAFRESKVRLASRRLLAAALIAGLLVLGARPALAQSSEQDQAREHYKKGLAAYNLGQYSEAASEFEAAYRLFLDPALLFNIAQAHRMNGELEKALNGYRSYLRTAPHRPRANRAQAEKWRQELEREVAKTKATPSGAATTPPAPVSKPPAPAPVTAAAPPPQPEPAPATPLPPAPSTTTAAPAPDPARTRRAQPRRARGDANARSDARAHSHRRFE